MSNAPTTAPTTTVMRCTGYDKARISEPAAEVADAVLLDEAALVAELSMLDSTDDSDESALDAEDDAEDARLDAADEIDEDTDDALELAENDADLSEEEAELAEEEAEDRVIVPVPVNPLVLIGRMLSGGVGAPLSD